MVAPLCKLTLVCPREIKPVIADALDSLEPAVPGYTVVDAQGHGPDAALSSAGERVQGAMRTAVFLLILTKDEADRVLAALPEKCRRRQIAFWIEPVNDYGRLT
jgi:hypothetical protein